MDKKLCIFGSGGFAREVYWLAKECGIDVDAFIGLEEGIIYDIPIKSENYFNSNKHNAAVAVGNPTLRKKIVSKIKKEDFQSLIHPTAQIMGNVKLGIGSVICSNVILTCDIEIGNWCHLNLATTIGHDVKAGDFLTTAPGVHINGKNNIGNEVYFGSNSSTRENINIGNNVIVGAGACAVTDLNDSGVYVGTPAKIMRCKNE